MRAVCPVNRKSARVPKVLERLCILSFYHQLRAQKDFQARAAVLDLSPQHVVTSLAHYEYSRSWYYITLSAIVFALAIRNDFHSC